MAYVMTMLNNVLITCVFGYLAIHFDKWWIVLFLVVGFMTIERTYSNNENGDHARQIKREADKK